MNEQVARSIQNNDQMRAQLFDYIKAAMQRHGPQCDHLLRLVGEEANARPLHDRNTQVGAYEYMRSYIMRLGLAAVQEKLAEWLESGEIGGGK